MKELSEMSYSEFSEYVNGEGYNRFDPVLSYDEFTIYFDLDTGRYYYFEEGENDADEFFEVELVAVLYYNSDHDIKLSRDKNLSHLFDCCACGEGEINDEYQYMWFQKKYSDEDDE